MAHKTNPHITHVTVGATCPKCGKLVLSGTLPVRILGSKKTLTCDNIVKENKSCGHKFNIKIPTKLK